MSGPAEQPGAIFVVLPNFDRVTIPLGARQLFGRESGDPVVDAALAPYAAAGVGRVHVVVRNDREGIFVERRSDLREIAVEGDVMPTEADSRMPVLPGQRIRLGSLCHLMIETTKGVERP